MSNQIYLRENVWHYISTNNLGTVNTLLHAALPFVLGTLCCGFYLSATTIKVRLLIRNLHDVVLKYTQITLKWGKMTEK